MARKKHVTAVFTVSDSVPQFMDDANALKTALTTAPGNTYVTIPPADITQFETDMTTLTAKQGLAEKGTEGAAGERDQAMDVVENTIRDWVRLVQNAADDAADEETAITIVQACGCRVKVRGVFVRPDFTVKLDKNIQGLVRLRSKAGPKNKPAIYEWQYSPNGVSFTTIKTTHKSYYAWLSGLAPGAKAFFRKRVSISDEPGEPAWSPVISIYIQ